MGDNSIRGNTIPKLRGTNNYKTWRIQIERILLAKKVLKYVTGRKSVALTKKQFTLVTGDGTTAAAVIDEDKFELALEEWQEEDTAAKAIIINNCVAEIIENTKNLKTSKEIWQRFILDYKPSGFASQMAKYWEFHTLQYDGKDIEKFTRDYCNAVLAVAEAGLELDSKIKVYVFINLVGPYYKSFAAALRQRLHEITDHKMMPSLDSIIANLLDEHKACSDYNTNFAHGKGQSQDNLNNLRISKGNKSGKPCTKCKTPKHDDNGCFKQHPEIIPDWWKEKNKKDDGNLSQSNTNGDSKPKPHRNFMALALTLSVPYKSMVVVSERVATALMSQHSGDWIVDSGCSTHMSPPTMKDMGPIDMIIQFGKGTTRAKGVGSITLITTVYTITITGVLWVSELVANLLSTEQLREKGLFYRNDKQVLFAKGNEIITHVDSHGALPYLGLEACSDCNPDSDSEDHTALASSKVLATSRVSKELWHLRMGHVQSENLIKAAENSTGIVIKSSAIDEAKCNICQHATSKRVMSRVPSQRLEEVYTKVNTDVITNSHPGYQKEKYLMLYTDSTSLYIHESMTSTKDGIKHEFKKHQTYISMQTGITIKWYRLDRGHEYGGLTEFIEEQGIRLHITSPHNSEQNGRAEVSNHIICTIARKPMLQAQLPPKFWPLAIKTAVLLHNLTPSDTLMANHHIRSLLSSSTGLLSCPILATFVVMAVGQLLKITA